MIWVIANRKEEDGSFPTYKYYKKAFADGKIDIFCADKDDDLVGSVFRSDFNRGIRVTVINRIFQQVIAFKKSNR